jgi:hypothetical protein
MGAEAIFELPEQLTRAAAIASSRTETAILLIAQAFIGSASAGLWHPAKRVFVNGALKFRE